MRSTRRDLTTYDNSGALFKNDKKEKPTHPNYKGELMVAGTPYWVSGWIKRSQAGLAFMSLALTPKNDRAAQEEPAKPETPRGPTFASLKDETDDIPF